MKKCWLLNQVLFWCCLFTSVLIDLASQSKPLIAVWLHVCCQQFLMTDSNFSLLEVALSCSLKRSFVLNACMFPKLCGLSFISLHQLLWHSASCVSDTWVALHICVVNIMASNPERLLRTQTFLLQILSYHLMCNMAHRWYRWNHPTSCKCW